MSCGHTSQVIDNNLQSDCSLIILACHSRSNNINFNYVCRGSVWPNSMCMVKNSVMIHRANCKCCDKFMPILLPQSCEQ